MRVRTSGVFPSNRRSYIILSMIRRIAWCVIWLVCAFPALAATYQFDDVIYDLPQGWSKGKTTLHSVTLFSNDDLGVYIYVFRSAPTKGPLKDWSQKRFEEVCNILNDEATQAGNRAPKVV